MPRPLVRQDVADEGVARSCKTLLELQQRSAEYPLNSLATSASKKVEGWAHYPSPFRGLGGDGWDFDNADMPRALVELKMCAVSNEIREKDRWWEKMRDESVRAKWRKEVEVHEEAEENVGRKLTDKMIDYVFQELEGYSAIRDSATDIQLACFERVWRSDYLIPSSLRQDLLVASALLQSFSPPDWRAGSDGQVLDLVHPSLYPIIYDHTHAWHPDDGQFKPLEAPRPLPGSSNTHLSRHFCWLPSDFSIAPDGTAKLISPYINNIDAQAHPSLNRIITSLVQAAVPLWERVLASLITPLSLYRMKTEGKSYVYTNHCHGWVKSIACVWKDCVPPYPEDDYDDEDTDKWYATQTDKFRMPDVEKRYDGRLEAAVQKSLETMEECGASLKGKTVQVIVKMVNVVLTPEKPEYGGGTWHVEGMENEHIVSTFIYYYAEDNVSESTISFRAATNQPFFHDQEDNYCMRTLYGLDRDEICVQERGSVTTYQHRSIAFPNIYQHRVSPFTLHDRTKPGHRKIIALLLVDPTIYIPSTTQIPPQQTHLYERAIVKDSVLLAQKLPVELRQKIAGSLGGGLMGREEAEEVKARFVGERAMDRERYGGENELFGLTFELWCVINVLCCILDGPDALRIFSEH
ncbi:hypothetical protein BDV98DRAFT_577376 [Pterulicium gracile]|uniref:Uncharacterized protein n=1 Tax=Pterulicium gracile TaxID=1884261 RepID=A0A5C3Q5M9_9AGAR|nr:hypothetical protein BDV98DRAFT_577376 [Pterula gracilis]